MGHAQPGTVPRSRGGAALRAGGAVGADEPVLFPRQGAQLPPGPPPPRGPREPDAT